jgi:hypothetical protein
MKVKCPRAALETASKSIMAAKRYSRADRIPGLPGQKQERLGTGPPLAASRDRIPGLPGQKQECVRVSLAIYDNEQDAA